MGVGRSRIKGILLYDDAMERLPPEERKRVESAFAAATEREDTNGKMKKASFAKCPLLVESGILAEVANEKAENVFLFF